MDNELKNVIFNFFLFIILSCIKKGMNRNPIKQWEVTFPQSGQMSKEEFILKFPPTDYLIICTEEHKDGGLHLHCGLKFKKPLTHSKLIKWISAKFPDDWKRIHISPIKNWEAWQDYCKKEDAEFIERGTLAKSQEQKLMKLYLKHLEVDCLCTFEEFKEHGGRPERTQPDSDLFFGKQK